MNDDADCAVRDVFLDHRLEEVMFRTDHQARCVFQRFYGNVDESVADSTGRLYTEARQWGEPLSEEQYFSPARHIATQAHQGQRFGTKHSYLFHLDSLASGVREQGLPLHAESAAYLHGVLSEGRGVTEADLRSAFPAEVIALLIALTRTESMSLERSLEQIRAAGPDAVCIKLVDSLSHCKGPPNEKLPPHVRAEYRQQLPLFRSILHRPGEHASLWTRLEYLLKNKPM